MEHPVLSVVCQEPEGDVTRNVYRLVFTPENLQKFWDKAKGFPTIYNTNIRTIEDFYNLFISEIDGKLELNGALWVIDDFVGIFYVSDITATEGNVHYIFFDKRHKGRSGLVKKMLKYVFQTYKFNRLNAEIPLYVTKYVRYFVTNIGFTLEGRKRKAAFYNGDWFDVLLFGLLHSDLE